MLISELVGHRRETWKEAIEVSIQAAPEGVTPDAIYSEDKKTVVDIIRYNDGSIAFHIQFRYGPNNATVMETPFPLHDIEAVLAIVAR